MIAPLTLLLAAAAVAAAPAGSPVPSPRPTATAAAKERVAIITCDRARFYNWPDPSGNAWSSTYPPGRSGDAIHVVGGDVLTPSGLNLTETTIDVVEPWGYRNYGDRAAHYWIATACIV